MRTRTGWVVLAGMLALAPAWASAGVMTYDFSGTGTVETFMGVGFESTVETTTFSGFVTIDSDPSEVAPAFTINWGGQSFRPADRANPLAVSHTVDVTDNGLDSYESGRLHDALAIREDYAAEDGGSMAQLTVLSYDMSWLSGSSVPQPIVLPALAPFGGYQLIDFANISFTDGEDPLTSDIRGYSGRILLDSFTVRDTATVPEPSTPALAAVGLLALGFARRRKLQS